MGRKGGARACIGALGRCRDASPRPPGTGAGPMDIAAGEKEGRMRAGLLDGALMPYRVLGGGGCQR